MTTAADTASPATARHGTVAPYEDFDQEFATTRRVLERYPDARSAWRPHEKSMTLSALATHVATLPRLGTTVLETDGVDVAGRQPPPPLESAAELLAAFDAEVAKFRAALAASDAAHRDVPWTLRAGERTMFTAPRRILLRTFMMHHLVHHRAQLGVYLRLLDVPVPSVYGPSADEPLAP